MAVYVVSDIHGEHKLFLKLLQKIEFKKDDTLYILGDIIDRGPNPITAMVQIMKIRGMSHFVMY